MEEEVGGSLLNSRRQRDHSQEQPKRADVRREQPKFVEDNRISDEDSRNLPTKSVGQTKDSLALI